MDVLHFRGEIAKVAANRDAIVKLDHAVGGASFAVLRRKLIGDEFEFQVGLEVEGTGERLGESIVAASAHPAGTVSALNKDDIVHTGTNAATASAILAGIQRKLRIKADKVHTLGDAKKDQSTKPAPVLRRRRTTRGGAVGSISSAGGHRKGGHTS